ncbi:Immunoglobulin V-set domain [Trinorchestia longiramus]|nr:Immunoglobulin V-set domain [Trinorchestia longiramus]
MRLATLLHLQLLLSATQGVFSLAANSSALVPATQPKTRENGGNAIRGDRPSDMYRSGNGSSSSFIITSSSATAQVGAIVFLPCRAPPDLAQQAQVSWVRRQDWHILTSGLQTYTKEQRFAVHHTNGSNEWTLAIKYVQLSDQGMYECQVRES